MTLKDGDIEILCAKDLTNYSWEQANTGSAINDKALTLEGNEPNQYHVVALNKGQLYPSVAVVEKDVLK